MTQDEFFMYEALKEAKKAYGKNEVPVGAVIVQDGKIIGRGHNLVESKKSALAHGEIIAIRNTNQKLKGWRLLNTTMYVTLEPCAMCAGAIINSRIDRLVIGAMDSKRGCCGSTIDLMDEENFNHRVSVSRGVLEMECSQIISKFFKELRNKK